MTGDELTEDERETLDALLPETGFEGLFDDLQDLIAKIVAARLAPVEAERDSFRARLAQAIGVPEPGPADLAKATHLSVRINADCAEHLAATIAKGGTSATEVVREAISLHKFTQEGGITRLVVEAADEKARADAAEAEVERLTVELAHYREFFRPDTDALVATWQQTLDETVEEANRQLDAAEARAAKAEALVEAGLGLADEWERTHLTGFCDSCAGISLGNQRWIAKRLRDTLGGAK